MKRVVRVVPSLALMLAASLAACTDSPWIVGEWLHLDEAGKIGRCYRFAGKSSFGSSVRTLTVFRGSECRGSPDALLSGRWQLKGSQELLLARGIPSGARLLLITTRTRDRFEVSGAMHGSFYRVQQGKTNALIAKLEKNATVKVRSLSAQRGCKYLEHEVGEIQRLPLEKNPRMLSEHDRGLAYHARDLPALKQGIAKVVYALNHDQLEWVALHFDAAAFNASTPLMRLTHALGHPRYQTATGSGASLQEIAMWKSYCRSSEILGDRDIDVTLFMRAAQKEGVYYLSEGVVARLWEDLRQTARGSIPH